MARDTLVDFFNDFAGLEKPFLIYDDGFRVEHYSYAEVAAKSREFAAWLRESGIAPGEKIILYSENRPEWLFALWGATLEGVIVVPIDYRSSTDFVERIKKIVDAKWLFAGGPLPASNNRPGGLFHANAATVAEIIFTSGATAEPKGVVITHGNVLANIVPVEREVRKYLRYERPFHPIRFLNLLPMSHMFGQAMATFVPPMIRGTVVFSHGYSPTEIVRQIRSRRVSALVCVPKVLQVLRDHVERVLPETSGPDSLAGHHFLRRWWHHRRAHRLFGWKFWCVICGAAPLEPDLENFWRALGFLVIQGYGLTETAPIVTLNHPFKASKGSVGTAIGGVAIKIADDGEVLVRGDNVTTGYYDPAGRR